MANLRSSRKNIRSSERKRRVNQKVLRRVRELIKKSEGLTKELQKLLDKGAKNRIIPKRKASRLKSKLSRRLKPA